ncbi:MAG: coenzyme F420-0:L-glutamate ligase [Nitrososphaeria archaeon]
MIKVELISCSMKKEIKKFNIYSRIETFFKKVGLNPENGDVLALSGKYLAISEGRFYKLEDVVPTDEAYELAKANDGDPRIAELVLRESEAVMPSFAGIFMASVKGMLQPNAGIDKSNIKEGYVVLYPQDPNASARKIRLFVLERYGVKVGVVVTDSRIYPTRKGTTGIAIGYSGILPIVDERGSKDLFGKKLKVTKRAIADQLATMVQPIMGESNESRPIVLIRGLSEYVVDGDVETELSVSYEEDIYFAAIKNYLQGKFYPKKQVRAKDNARKALYQGL